MLVVVNRGNSRKTLTIGSGRSDRIGAATDIKRFLFPTNGAYHKAKRRGERALQVPA